MASQVEIAKSVPGAPVPLLVDGFRFQTPACRHYFLTHAHSDHTTGLSRHFDAGQWRRHCRIILYYYYYYYYIFIIIFIGWVYWREKP